MLFAAVSTPPYSWRVLRPEMRPSSCPTSTALPGDTVNSKSSGPRTRPQQSSPRKRNQLFAARTKCCREKKNESALLLPESLSPPLNARAMEPAPYPPLERLQKTHDAKHPLAPGAHSAAATTVSAPKPRVPWGKARRKRRQCSALQSVGECTR